MTIFYTEIFHECERVKKPQFNFSSQNLNIERNFFKWWDGKVTKIWYDTYFSIELGRNTFKSNIEYATTYASIDTQINSVLKKKIILESSDKSSPIVLNYYGTRSFRVSRKKAKKGKGIENIFNFICSNIRRLA